MPDMPRKLPPFVNRQRTRHGKTVYYFRRGKGKWTRLPDLNTPEFDAAYMAALAGQSAPKPATTSAGSLAWLIRQYRQSQVYLKLSHGTRRARDGIFRKAIEAGGAQPYRAITKAGIAAARDKRAPNQARHFLDAMRGLFRWAEESGLIDKDPTDGVRNPTPPKTDGFVPWDMEDVARYRERWPLGTKERVWLEVLLATGFRRGDAATVGWQHMRDGIVSIRTKKTGMEVSLPISAELAASLAAGPTGDLAWICGARGEPLTKDTFGNAFREACKAAGVTKRAHGLRKLGAITAAEAGLSTMELDALFGWEGGKMASHYTKGASRKRLAIHAAEKIANNQRLHLVSGIGGNANKPIKSKGEN